LLVFDEIAPDSEPIVDINVNGDGVTEDPASMPAVAGVVSDSPAPGDNLDSKDELTDIDLRILELERRWFNNMGAKEAAITREFNITATRYFQILNGLIDNPRAMHAQPQVIARLRRVRANRQRARSQCGAVVRQRRQRAAL
jgi:hypothetical protein